jgi:uncharacterized protein YicC (UPF0701 family)
LPVPRLRRTAHVVEPALRELINARLSRGKVECRLNFVSRPLQYAQPQPQWRPARAPPSIRCPGAKRLPLAAPLAVNDVLHWPGIFGDDSLDSDALSPACLALAKDALDDFTASRAREGAKLTA